MSPVNRTFAVHVGMSGCLPDHSTFGIASAQEAADCWADEVRATAEEMPDRNRDAVLRQIAQDTEQVVKALDAGIPWRLTVDGYVHEVVEEARS